MRKQNGTNIWEILTDTSRVKYKSTQRLTNITCLDWPKRSKYICLQVVPFLAVYNNFTHES